MPWRPLRDHAQILAVHAAYMGFGKILYFGGDEFDAGHNTAGHFKATRLYDCASGAVTVIDSPHFDAFCAGQAFLVGANIVRLLVAGGTDKYPGGPGLHHDHFPGLRDAAIFSSPDFVTPSAGGWSWSPAARMNPGTLSPTATDRERTGGRWYPTLVTLPTGDVIAFSGHPGSADAEHINFIPEIFTQQPHPHGRWRRVADYSNTEDHDYYQTNTPLTYYPRMHLLPAGDIVCTNPIRQSTISFTPDVGPRGGMFKELCGFPGSPINNPLEAFSSFGGTSVLLPLRHSEEFKGIPRNIDGQVYNALVIICGSFTQIPYMLFHSAPTTFTEIWGWSPTAPRPMVEHRAQANSVILPTGEIFVCGGINSDRPAWEMEFPPGSGVPSFPDTKGVLMPEVYNPYSNTWDIARSSTGDSTHEAAQVVRNYHSVALLMPDGRVWTAGSSKNHWDGIANRNRDIEIYEPWYVGNPGRPRVTGAPSLAYPRQTILVKTTFADEIRRVVLVRCGTCTHAFNSDQRMLELAFRHPGGDDLLVDMPPNNNILPPGPYYIFTIRGGKPEPDADRASLGLPSFATDIYIVEGRQG